MGPDSVYTHAGLLQPFRPVTAPSRNASARNTRQLLCLNIMSNRHLSVRTGSFQASKCHLLRSRGIRNFVTQNCILHAMRRRNRRNSLKLRKYFMVDHPESFVSGGIREMLPGTCRTEVYNPRFVFITPEASCVYFHPHAPVAGAA